MRYKKNNFVFSLLKYASDLFSKITKNRKRLAFFILATIIGLFLIKRYEKFFFTILLSGIGAVSLIHSRYFKYSYYLGVELCIMATVLTALKYGTAFGMFTGFFSIFTGFVLSGHFKPTYFVSVLAMPLLGAIVPLFSNMSLLWIGMLMTVMYDAIILPLYILFGSRVVSSIIFFATHLIFNYWVFTTIAPLIYSFM